uniref:Avirulence factor 9 n=1 Tax=Zymoseptoria tritici TaxID=1047171 RepID=A0A9E7YWV7_ZYMTR|nr:avirulence factor 9 [Zymoseptoria tritici]
MLVHSLLIAGCTVATAAGSRHLGYDFKPKESSLQSLKRDLVNVGVGVGAGVSQRQDGRSSTDTTVPCNSTIPNNTTDTSCGQLVAGSQNLDGFGGVPAALAYQCLMSIPFHQEDALFHIETLMPYIGYHADLTWVANPPEEYVANVRAPFDILGCFNDLKAAVTSGLYTSEYLFSLDLEKCFVSVNDYHFGYVFDMAGGLVHFAKTYSLISASSDGESPPAIYVYDDINAIMHGATFEPSPIVKINGEDAVEVLLEASKAAPIQDPDAAWNILFGTSIRQFGLFTARVPTNAWYPGPNTSYEFANGTQLIDQTLAFLDESITPNKSIQTGEDFYQRFVGWSTTCDADGAGAVSVYEYSVCDKARPKSSSTDSSGDDTSSSDGADSPPPGPLTPPDGWPVPVVSLNDSLVWGFFPEAEGTQDVAVLVFASSADVNDDPFDDLAVADFLGEFYQQAADAKRTKLIIDLSQNLGGFDVVRYLYSALFPDLPAPIWGGTAAATDTLDLIGQEYSYSLGVSDPNSLQRISDYESYNYRTDVDINGNNFTSWEQKFGPKGSPFTPYWRNVDWPVKTPRSPFIPEDTVLLTDGIVASSGATLAEVLMLQASVRTVAFGGRPGVQQMQAVGGTRSLESKTFLSLFQDVGSVFLEGKLHDAAFYNNTALGEFNVLPLIRSKANNLAFRLGQDPTDPELIPIMYKYQPADFHIQYTFENVLNATARWRDAAVAAFQS